MASHTLGIIFEIDDLETRNIIDSILEFIPEARNVNVISSFSLAGRAARIKVSS